MKDMNQLRDLLKHEIKDLCSCEEQIIDALPKMVEKATDPKLKQALNNHLRVTETHRNRLDEVLKLLEDRREEKEEEKGGLIGLFKGSGKQTCKGTKGLIEEGESVMKEDMTSDVMDAAIIACAQKIEHYEICAYGTTRAYAEELGLNKVEKLLRQTLEEEYEADDLLTEMAMGRLNLEAINGSRNNGRNPDRNTGRSNKNSSDSRRSTSPNPKSESRSTSKSPSKVSGSKATSSSSKSKSTQPKKKVKSSSR